MKFDIRKATRAQTKIKLCLSGPEGSGKTYSALLIAYGLCKDWEKIVVIDTENRSADLYTNLGSYSVCGLSPPFSPEKYIDAIEACEDAGFEVIIIDSISHEWEGPGGCLEIHEQLGGKFQTWAQVTPRHRAFIDKVLRSKVHVICAARTKVEYVANGEGKNTKFEKQGTKQITREGFGYELTLGFDMDVRNNASCTKDRTGIFKGKPSFVPSINTGELIKKWCEEGMSAEDLNKKIDSAATCEELNALFRLGRDLNISSPDEIKTRCANRKKILIEIDEKKDDFTRSISEGILEAENAS